MPIKISSFLFFLLLLAEYLVAQNPLRHFREAVDTRYSNSQPVVTYIITVSDADLSSYSVEMRIRNISDSFQVAMVAHPEYDDRYWRYLEDVKVEGKSGPGIAKRLDSSLWKIVTNGHEATIRYRLHLPEQTDELRASWRPFLSANGGLIGGPHSFLYVVGSTLIPSQIKLILPLGWQIATGLIPTHDPQIFSAPSVFVLIDAPILVGKYKHWSYEIDGIPHRVIYLSPKGNYNFDSSAMVDGLEKIAREASSFFGRLPYREYFFMIQDGAYGSLEHLNSLTVGATSQYLSQGLRGFFGEVAHEYFHTWNLMRIHPVEYGDVEYKTPPLSKNLWWSEGLTMFYADLFLRRASLPRYDTTRIQHLETLIRRYYNSSGNSKISPERVSLASYGPPGMLGDFNASSHLQGELIGIMLDLMIRDKTNNKKSIDDLMRLMMQHYSGEKGFSGNDIEAIVNQTCQCDVHPFFRDYVFGNKAFDLNHYLALAGLTYELSSEKVKDNYGSPSADMRIYAWKNPGENLLRIGITEPGSCWGQSGLHTNDQLLRINDTTFDDPRAFRQWISTRKIGDSVSFEVMHLGKRISTVTKVSGYTRPVVRIRKLSAPNEKQSNVLHKWTESANETDN